MLGRKNIYRMYLGVGALLYLAVTLTTNTNKVAFLVCCMLILSFYGAGFATVPAYLRDLFGKPHLVQQLADRRPWPGVQ